MHRVWAYLLFSAVVSIGLAPRTTQAQPVNCSFQSYLRHDAVTSWELQLDVPSTKQEELGATRTAILGAVQWQLLALKNGSTELNIKVDADSLRTSIFDQRSTAGKRAG
jgi:hypothetical protein